MSLIQIKQGGYGMMRIPEKIDLLIQVIEDVMKDKKSIVMRRKLEDMMHDVDEYFVDHPHLFESLKNDAEKSLYVGSKFIRLSAMLRLYNLKVKNG